MSWTEFMDMHSGGGQKLEWSHIFIEAPEDEARAIFFNRFGRNPERVTCTCCGEDYSVSEHRTLAAATGYERNCNTLETPRLPDGRFDNDLHNRDAWFAAHYYIEPEDEDEARRRGWTVRENTSRQIGREYGSDYGRHLTLTEYEAKDDVLIVRAEEISDDERVAKIPDEGYVWVGADD